VFVILLLICSNYYCKVALMSGATSSTMATSEAASSSLTLSAAETSNKVASTSQIESTLATETTTVTADLSSRLDALEAKMNAISGTLNTVGSASTVDSTGVNLMNYMYKDAIIYQDIFNAYNSNIFQKVGSPAGWDETSYATNPWNGRRILKIGGGVNSNGNGMLVHIPDGYNVLWLRVLGDRWATFRVTAFNPSSTANFQDWTEIYASGYRRLTTIAPDGTGHDSNWDTHQWMPIPIRAAGSYMIYSAQNSDDWISGIAFGKNLWNHAMNSAIAYNWKLNSVTGNIGWTSENWNNDQLAYLPAGSVYELAVPVIPNGKDKLIYFVNHNDNWNGSMHGAVQVNGQVVERFRTSYNNPFAAHFNSKFYNRYMATRIPAAYIAQGDKFVTVRIDMTNSNNHLYFREMGTHDYF